MHKTKILIISLIILSALTRVWFFFKSDNFEGNVPMGKIASALNIIANPRLGPHFAANTSMLYNYLLAVWLRIWPDVLIAPRVLSMLFGVLSIIPFYFLIRLIFTETTAFYSSILLSIFPLHAIYSTCSTSDIISHFFFFSCLYFIFKFKLEEKKILWLVLSIISFNITSQLRFESWAFIPVLSALLFKEGKKYSALFFFSSLILPCLWMLLCYSFQKDALASFTVPARVAHFEILMERAPHSRSPLDWLNVLGNMLGYTIVLSGLGGIIYSFIRKRFFYLALFFSYVYLLYTVNGMAERMLNNERYGIILALFLFPYSVIFIEKLSVFLKSKPIVLFLPVILLSSLEFNKSTHRYIAWHTLPGQIKEIAGWLKKNVSSSDKILIGADKGDQYVYDIIVRSTIAPENFFNVSFFCPWPTLTKADIESYITAEKPDYLVLDSKGFLNNLLNFDANRNQIEEFGCLFKRIYSKWVYPERFNIYKIYYGMY